MLHGSRGMPLFILDNFRSAFNVGSVFRSAEAVSPAGIMLTGICCRPGNRKLGRTARGTHALVPWRYFSQLSEAIGWARSSGRMIVAVENAPSAVPIWEVAFDSPPAFILGSEADGLDEEVVSLSDKCVFFPQSGIRTSINVASAASLAAFEIQRRRMNGTCVQQK